MRRLHSISIMPDPRASFAERVYALVARIPPGRVSTYGMIARQLGVPRAARTVGWAMHNCPEGLPWHRVVAASGRPAGDPTSPRAQIQWALLQAEGVDPSVDAVSAPRIDLARYGWDATEDVADA